MADIRSFPLARRLRRLARRAWLTLPFRLRAFFIVCRILLRPEFAGAEVAVRKVATDPDMRNLRGPLAYQHIQNHSGLYHNFGENFIRAVEARQWTHHILRDRGMDVPEHRTGLLTELVYTTLKES